MAMYEVHKALVESYIDLQLGIDTAFENDDFKPTRGRIFAAINLITNNSESLGKGELDIDEVTGFFQISFYTPSGSNVGKVLPMIDKVLSFYKHNRKLTSDCQEVVIVDSGRNGGRNDDGWWIVDCTINFKTDIQRV